ncbi:MAG TPA: SIS domain-containing protein [Saprospiraceae bacterium]|nr:SIS domain-containing protein [Saprospiraceae bacterium]
MKAFEQYISGIQSLTSLLLRQKEKIIEAGELVAHTIENNGYIYASGTGHSHMLAEEIFYRAGGFARVIPVLDEGLMLHKSASGSTVLERKENLGRELLIPYSLTSNDVLIVASNSGRNSVSIEMAMYAREQVCPVIAITSLQHTLQVDSRHSSGKRLFEVSDVFIDNLGCFGDTSVELPGMSGKVGATSTVMGAMIVQSLIVHACHILIQKGIVPEVFSSSNTDEGDAMNDLLLSKYKSKVPLL